MGKKFLVVASLFIAFYVYQENFPTIAGDNLTATPWQRWERWPALKRNIVRAGRVLYCGSHRHNLCSQSDMDLIHLNSTTVSATCPKYFNWINKDLEPWKTTGIRKWDLEVGVRKAAFRVTIVGGKLYAEYYYSCHWDRTMFTIWGLLRLLDRFPGQIKDVDLLFNCADLPRIHSSDRSSAPLFGYSTKTDNSSLDIPFPDWSFWGWPEMGIQNWERESDAIFQSASKMQWMERSPRAYWKGDPHSSHVRDLLLKCNSSTSVDVRSQDWKRESKNGFKNSDLAKQCTNRYKIYAEGNAWSVSFKYIMACGSVVLNINQKFQDFFTRAIVPWFHYVPVSSDPREICLSLDNAVSWGNQHPKQAEDIAKQGQEFIKQDLHMDRIYDYMFYLLNGYADLQKFKPKVPKGAVRECPQSVYCVAHASQKKFLAAQQKPDPATPCMME